MDLHYFICPDKRTRAQYMVAFGLLPATIVDDPGVPETFVSPGCGACNFAANMANAAMMSPPTSTESVQPNHFALVSSPFTTSMSTIRADVKTPIVCLKKTVWFKHVWMERAR